ncbi:hypothetical protein [Halomonas nitroreducens]|uniref:DUF4349 domain-containing protein n=1 Tax=Halomonas nitroreducens TaxID=447425 RepID=A0A3S0I8T4_9GAMM|nr:hypothetical protein [Halomonas nitroreducens]RTR05218.1 hypothetical protein EKG36_06430 [Halomonas nitroreducens]
MDRLSPRSRTAILCLMAAAMVLMSLRDTADRRTEAYVEAAMAQALAAFATARALNGGISVLQSTEVGVGVASTQPLEVLDPLNDMVEDYADIMQLSIGSLVTQKVLIEIVSTDLFKLLLTLSGLLLVLSLVLRRGRHAPFFLKAFLLAALARFVLVVAMLLNGLVDQAVIDARAESNMATVDGLAHDIAGLEGRAPLGERSRDALEQRLTRLEADRQRLAAERAEGQQRLAAARAAVDRASADLARHESQLGLVERLNLFRRDDAQARLQRHLEARRERRDESREAQRRLADRWERLEADIAATHEALSGEPDEGWLSGLTARLASLRNATSLEALSGRVEASVTAMLTLMALFLFRTLLLPLAMLVLLLKGFRLIWRLDHRRWLGRRAGPSRGTS